MSMRPFSCHSRSCGLFVAAAAWACLPFSCMTIAYGETITSWNFSGDVLTPATGSGSASGIGGVSSSFSTINDNTAWVTGLYPAQSTGSGTAGGQFMTSTQGYKDITVSFAHYGGNTASRWAQLDYTTDGGTNWTTGFWNNSGGLTPNETWLTFLVDLSSLAPVNDNPSFGFRIVSIFSPLEFDQNASLDPFAANAAYMRTNPGAVYSPDSGTGTGGSANYTPGGQWRFDDVTISGVAVPEPSAIALTGIVALALGAGAIRRSRKARKASLANPA